MKKIKVGINGFGRIGRAVFRINHIKKYFEVVAINDINPDINNLGYLLKYDTTYGRFIDEIKIKNQKFTIDNKTISYLQHKRISDVPWDQYDVDLVIDSSGIKSNLDEMLNSSSDVKNFIVTNAPQDYPDIKTIIFGVNENEIDANVNRVFSSSICDTIALAPIIETLEKINKIESGFLTTLHPWLSYQNLLDGPSVSWSQPGDINSHYALGRASTENLIPKSTSAVLAADLVFPGISKKINSFSYRTPTKIVSSAVLILNLSDNCNEEEIKDIFIDYEKNQKVKVFHNNSLPLTSLDYTGQEFSAIIDNRWIEVVNEKHLKLVYWYDNEWGYSSRVVDLANEISKTY